MPSEPGCIALANDGLVVACRDGFYRFFPATETLTKIADAPYDQSNMRFNDGKCDAHGRFWAGAMYEPRTAALAAMFVLERGLVRTAWGPAQGFGVKVSNGLAFAADGRSVYQSDTPNHVVYRFAIDAHGSALSRDPWVRCPADKTAADYGGRPDGATLDRAGNYWSAQYEGGRVVCFSPAGEIEQVIHVAAKRTTMAAFGGADLQTLYITTAREGASADELLQYPQSGGIFACRLDHAQGLPAPFYLD